MNKRNVTKEETRGNMNERNAIKEKTQLKETRIVESTDMIVKKRKKAEENGNIVKLKKAGKNKTDIDVNSSMATYKNIINSELTSAQGIGQNKMITRSSSIDMYSSIHPLNVHKILTQIRRKPEGAINAKTASH